MKWQNFLACKKKKNPNIENELQGVMDSLTALWIVKMKEEFQCSLEEDIVLAKPAFAKERVTE
jgi:hypothetical protein